jgi:tetratricopeptide (TPR) repeat protein
LQKAEILNSDDFAEQAVTYNNMGVLYRRQNKLHTALKFLRQAADLEATIDKVKQPGDVHINLCVTLSQCGKHKPAIVAIKRALQLLEQELFSAVHPGQKQTHKHRADRIATMAVAYHNLGVECEYLFKMTDALKAYGSGVELSSTYLGEEHGITLTLRKAQTAARQAIEKNKRKKEKEGEKAQRVAEEMMLRAIRETTARQRLAAVTAQQDEQLVARKIRPRDGLDALVEANTYTIKDTEFGQGRRSRAPSEIKLQAKLQDIQQRGVVRSGSQKTSSAALLSHVDGGKPSLGPVKRKTSAVQGGMLFQTAHTTSGSVVGDGRN